VACAKFAVVEPKPSEVEHHGAMPEAAE
jgi:hypothetical protein